MSALPLILFAAGTGMMVAGQWQETQAQVATTKYNAAVARMQAEQYRRVGALTERQIREAGELTEKEIKEAAELEQYRLGRQKRALTGAQRALYAKAGVLIEGSPLEVMADTASQFELDLSLSRFYAQRGIAVTKYGVARDIAISKYETETAVRKYGYEAKYRDLLAKQYKRIGLIKMGGTLLTSSVAGYGAFKTPTTTKLPYVPGKGYGPV